MNPDHDLKVVACKVVSILIDQPECRDNDRLLLAEIWRKELNESQKSSVLDALVEGSISNPESITRMRRKLQETHPNLHQMEGVFCQQLDFFDRW
jgi:hypothetical protein